MNLIKVPVMFCALAVCLGIIIADTSFSIDAYRKHYDPAITEPNGSMLIGYIESRNRVVTISRGEEGSVFTISTKAGETVATGLNEYDFQKEYPALYHQFKTGIAGNDAMLRIDPQFREILKSR